MIDIINNLLTSVAVFNDIFVDHTNIFYNTNSYLHDSNFLMCRIHDIPMLNMKKFKSSYK